MFQTKVTFAPGQTPEQRRAHVAHWRRQDAWRRDINNLFGFWRVCGKPQCRRGQTCSHDMRACFERLWPLVPEENKQLLRGGIIAKRDGAADDEIIRSAKARREQYLKQMERTETLPAQRPPVEPARAAAVDPEIRIRRL
jgi:hypothetical protein